MALLREIRKTRLIWLCVLGCGIVANAQSPPTNILDVKTIFVDSLGQGEYAPLIRDKIINRLVTSGRFQVALDPDKADAVLTGSGEVSTAIRYNNGNGGSRADATVVVRLVSKDQKILWVFEAKNGGFTRSASSSVADKVVKGLIKAATPPKK